ncbi:MAG TPA: DUF4058 family protein [Phototrophicaceae bacterium]|nr:DUF4058 family protein [Phototrophicaceae bacterium]
MDMPIHFRENQYTGVNAHLHSLLQREGGGWEVFHGAYILYLTEVIDGILPDGYYVLNEKSLQISAIDLYSGDLSKSRSRPDLSIYEQAERSPGALTFASSAAPTTILSIPETLPDEDYLQSVVVYQQASLELSPIVRIELLSPANKSGGSYADIYMEKRKEVLENRSRLIELDFLHESRSHIAKLPSYPRKEANAHPYLIAVNDPHPSLEKGYTSIYGFDVETLIPQIEVPLSDDNAISIDFNAVYNRTFASNRYYGTILVDYQQLPVNFESYTEADQQRIRERMRQVQAKQ